jgi:hypothetical protein
MRPYAGLVRSGRGNVAERLALLEMRHNLDAVDRKIGRYRERITS